MKQVRAEVLSTRRLGAYRSVTLVAPEIAERARPGQFISVRMPEGREFLLRRHFFIHQASRRGGWAGTLEFAFDSGGPGSAWLGSVRAHQFLDILGPLGKPFAYPRSLSNCLILADGHAAAPAYFLAQELLARHKRVDMIVGGPTLEGVFKPIEGKRLSQTIAIVTADGTLGERGHVFDVLDRVVQQSSTQVIYALAEAPTLRRIAAFCAERKIPAQVAVEEPFACGVGLCFSCVVPIALGESGIEHVRACVDGPVFNPAKIVWDRWPPAAVTERPAPPRVAVPSPAE